MTDSAQSSPPLLEVRDCVMRFGGVVAVDHVSLQAPAGAVTGLIGPNGAGKSTLFGVCSGLLAPTQGRVLIAGADVTRVSARGRARRGLARTFQQPEIFFTMTVREHLELAHRARTAPRRVLTDLLPRPAGRRAQSEERAQIDHLLEILGLTAAADVRAALLPLGQQRRLEIGRALASQPRLLLLDEPSSGLDPPETAQLGEVLTQTAEGGVALLLVEHDLDLVLGVSQYVHVIDFGKLIYEGTPAEVRQAGVVRAAYLGQELESAPTATGVDG